MRKTYCTTGKDSKCLKYLDAALSIDRNNPLIYMHYYEYYKEKNDNANQLKYLLSAKEKLSLLNPGQTAYSDSSGYGYSLPFDKEKYIAEIEILIEKLGQVR